MTVNPQAFMSSYLSGMRNSIITLSLGVAIYGFSRSFKKQTSRDIMKLVSTITYIFSVAIIINTTLSLKHYLDVIDDKDIERLPKFVALKYWKNYEYLGWLLTGIGSIILLLSLKGYVKMAAYYFKKMLQ
jgi:hypothetical protein